MKKFLLIGALLALGATSSFGAVTEVLQEGKDSQSRSGSASLRLEAKGNIIDATDKAVLVITPTSSAGPDGESLVFDFGDVIEGRSTSLTGKFDVEVITKSQGTNDIKNIPLAGKVTAKLVNNSTASPQGSNKLEDLSLTNVKKEEVGKLGYKLVTTANHTKLKGIVAATVDIAKEKTGSFVNTDGAVKVEVTDLPFPVGP